VRPIDGIKVPLNAFRLVTPEESMLCMLMEFMQVNAVILFDCCKHEVLIAQEQDFSKNV